MRVLLSLRKLHLQRTVNGCNGYKSALLKPRGAVYASSALRISRWSSSFSSSTHSSTGSTEDSGLSLISDTKNTLPVKFDEQANVEGAETQVVTIELKPGNTIRAEAGNLIYMSEGVEMETSTGGGLKKMFSRVLTGQNLMVTDFSFIEEGTNASSGTVALGARIPSKIIKVNLEEFGGSLVCQKGAFLAGSSTIDIKTEFTRTFGAGFFGGEGFILQRLSGDGDAFICGSGHIIKRELEEGETLRVSSGCIVAFGPSVRFDIQMVKGGIFSKNAIFGGEGIFLTSLTGPGTIWLSGLPFDRMVGEIGSRLPSRQGMPIMMPVGGAGAGGGEGEGGTDSGDTASVGAIDQGAEATSAGSATHEGGIFGDATPPPSETINIDDPPSDPNFSQDTGTGSEETWGEESFSEPPPSDSSWTDSVSDTASTGDEDSHGVIGSLWDWWNEN